MKYQVIILSILALVSLSADCNNPLIDPTMPGILKTPVVADANLKFCPGLAGKEICCDASAMTNFVTKMKDKNRKFEKRRKKQPKMQMMLSKTMRQTSMSMLKWRLLKTN